MPGDGDAATADDKENGASMGPAGAKSTAMDTAGAQSAGAEGGAPAADGDAPQAEDGDDEEDEESEEESEEEEDCLLYTSPSPRDQRGSRMPSSA